MSSETQKILTTDGIPLEVSLKKAERKNKLKAFLLVAPLLLFLIISLTSITAFLLRFNRFAILIFLPSLIQYYLLYIVYNLN